MVETRHCLTPPLAVVAMVFYVIASVQDVYEPIGIIQGFDGAEPHQGLL